MIPARITSHPDAAALLLTEKWQGKRVTEGLLRALVTPFDALEAATWDTLEGRVMGAAGCQGYWLDALGSLVTEKRNGRDDTAYLAAIRVRIRVNRSQGRAIDVIEVARLLDITATYVEHFPMAWAVDTFVNAAVPEAVVLLAETKAITSYGIVRGTPGPSSDVFKWDHAGGAGANIWASHYSISPARTWAFGLTTNPAYKRFTA